jgi:O-methyltransferase involved in polyketide biosynthesis
MLDACRGRRAALLFWFARVARMDYESVRGCAALMAPRTIAIDEAVREHPTGQLVVLGAGLVTRAWRMGELADTIVFEIDHPATRG